MFIPVVTTMVDSALKKGQLSGILPGWRSNANYRNRPKNGMPAYFPEEPKLGGLDDEDASAVQPTLEAAHAEKLMNNVRVSLL
jgi:hypothetical protein